MATDKLLNSFLFLLLQIRHHLLTGYAHCINVEIPCHGTLFHLFSLAKYVYDAKLTILKYKIKSSSEHFCKTVYGSVFGSLFVNGREELHALRNTITWNEITAKAESLLGTQLIATLNSTNGEKQDMMKDSCLQIYHKTAQLQDQNITRHKHWEH